MNRTESGDTIRTLDFRESEKMGFRGRFAELLTPKPPTWREYLNPKLEARNKLEIRNPNEAPRNGVESLPESLVEHLPQHLVENLVENLPENLVESLPERLPESLVESLPENLPESLPESLVEHLPEGLPEGLVEHLPERTPLDGQNPGMSRRIIGLGRKST